MEHSYFKERISAHYDGELPPYEEEVMREHLQTCDECNQALRQLKQLDDLTENSSELAESDYWEKSAAKIDARIGAESSTAVPSKTKSSSGMIWKLTPVLAVAAVLAFVAVYQTEIMQTPTGQEDQQIESPELNEAIQLKTEPEVIKNLDRSSSSEKNQPKPSGDDSDFEVKREEPKATESDNYKRDTKVPSVGQLKESDDASEMSLDKSVSTDSPPPQAAPALKSMPLRAMPAPKEISIDQSIGIRENEEKSEARYRKEKSAASGTIETVFGYSDLKQTERGDSDLGDGLTVFGYSDLEELTAKRAKLKAALSKKKGLKSVISEQLVARSQPDSATAAELRITEARIVTICCAILSDSQQESELLEAATILRTIAADKSSSERPKADSCLHLHDSNSK